MNTQVQLNSKPSNDLVNRLSDADLLGELIGVQESRQHYQGSLVPFFGEGQAQSHTKCAVARELVKRWLHEEMKHREVFSDPRAVFEYLKVHFAGREYESFVVLYPLCQTSCRLSSFSSGFSAEAINNETNSVFP